MEVSHSFALTIDDRMTSHRRQNVALEHARSLDWTRNHLARLQSAATDRHAPVQLGRLITCECSFLSLLIAQTGWVKVSFR